MSNYLAQAFPVLAERLPHLSLGDLPTPVSREQLVIDGSERVVFVKHDEITGKEYGGNKLRKLEYILQQARDKGATRIATFGTVNSHHALATALYAKRSGFQCSCFLSHQSLQPGIGDALRFHLQNGTEIISFGGNRAARIRILRENLLGRHAWVVPLGGSSWQGSIGYVNAALELAQQIHDGEIDCPARVYVALGTTGTAVGLALGFALAGLDTEVHAIRVTLEIYSGDIPLQRMLRKSAHMMHRLDPSIPFDLADSAKLIPRNGFFGAGYGRTNEATDDAIAIAQRDLGLQLETTYSGKTMAGLRHDLAAGFDEPVLFWNTYNSRPLNVDRSRTPDFNRVPREFQRYFD